MINGDGAIIEDVVLCAEEGRYGVNIPKGVWHTIEAMEPDSVIFECGTGGRVPVSRIIGVSNNRFKTRICRLQSFSALPDDEPPAILFSWQ